MQNIKIHLPANLDPLLFAYRANGPIEDTMSAALHLSLTHLENKNTCARILLIDSSLAFNTILPQQLVDKLRTLNPPWWALQGCILNPSLSVLLTLDCSAKFNNNHIIKYPHDTTFVGLIYDEDESSEVRWSTNKPREMIIDLKNIHPNHYPPLTNSGSVVEGVNTAKFWGYIWLLTWHSATTPQLSLTRLNSASTPPQTEESRHPHPSHDHLLLRNYWKHTQFPGLATAKQKKGTDWTGK